MSSEQINEQLDISVGSPAQIRFEQAITGSDLEATVALRFDIPGADRDDVIVEILGEPPENVFISTSSATCSGCGDSVSVRFSLVPDSDIDFGTVFLHAVSEIRPDEWSETNGVLLELKRVAIEEADGVLVLAEAVREDDQRAWELSASPNVELEIISSSSLEVYGASDSRVLVGSQQRLQFDKCQACPERPIYLWGKGGDAVAWRLVTVDPKARATARPLTLSTAEASTAEGGLALLAGEKIQLSVTVSIDADSVEPDGPRPAARLWVSQTVEPDMPHPRSSQVIVNPIRGMWLYASPMRSTPTGWEIKWVVEYDSLNRDIGNFTADLRTRIEWIDELAPLEPESIRIDVEQ